MRVLLVDHNLATVASVEHYLRTRGHSVTVCSGGKRALSEAMREPPALIILDTALPDVNGLEVCRRIRERAPQPYIPILFLSARATTEDRIAGLEAGGDDFVAKPFDIRELSLRIEGLLRRPGERARRSQPADLVAGGLSLNMRTFKAEVDGKAVQLTPVEFELLRYLMQHPGQVVSSEQLLQDVWRYYPGTGDAAVVRVQVMNLRNKLERDRTSPRYIQTIYRHGYMIAA